MDEFGEHIAVTSNGSLDLFPDNTPSNFINQLPERKQYNENTVIGMKGLKCTLNIKNAGSIHYSSISEDSNQISRIVELLKQRDTLLQEQKDLKQVRDALSDDTVSRTTREASAVLEYHHGEGDKGMLSVSVDRNEVNDLKAENEVYKHENIKLGKTSDQLHDQLATTK
jgi:hypothetical protein